MASTNIYQNRVEYARQFTEAFDNNLVACKMVSQDLTPTVGSDPQNGDTIKVRHPRQFIAGTGRTRASQPRVDKSTDISVNFHENIGLDIPIDEKVLKDPFFKEDVKTAAYQLAADLDMLVSERIFKQAYQHSGTPGTPLATYAPFADAYAAQTDIGTPVGSRYGIITPTTRAKVSDTFKNLQFSEVVKSVIKGAYTGNIADWETGVTAQLYKHTTGTRPTAMAVNGAVADGATQMVIDGGAGTESVVEGDKFSIAGIYEVNQLSRQSTGRLQQFTVTEDLTLTGGGGTLKFSPAINAGTATETNHEGVSVSLAAYQNVTATAADDAVITFTGAADTTYDVNIFWHKRAGILAPIKLQKPRNDSNAAQHTSRDSGFSVLVSGGYDQNAFVDEDRLDLMAAFELVRPEMSHVIFG